MQTYDPTYDFRKFLDWFGNVRTHVDIDLEEIQDAAAMGENIRFPFTMEELKAWQEVGLIKISETSIGDDFKPYQTITLNYSMRRNLNI